MRAKWSMLFGPEGSIILWPKGSILFGQRGQICLAFPITYGTQMKLDKWNYSDSQAVRLTIRYAFNSTMSKYKGRGAGQSEKNRL